VLQVSYSSVSPSLSNKKKYGRFFRTIPYEVFVSRARYAIMKKYNWRKVALLYETQTIYATVRTTSSLNYVFLWTPLGSTGVYQSC